MFDALNREFPAEGVKKNSKDIEVFYVYLCCCLNALLTACLGFCEILFYLFTLF